jgi:Fic family protein
MLQEDNHCLHYELINIHLFREGNGRIARIFSDLMPWMAGYPTQELNRFRVENYSTYIEALNQEIKKTTEE